MSTLSRGQTARLQTVFTECDRDRSGTLNLAELGLVMERFGHDMNSDQLEALMEKVNDDGTGNMTFEEFVSGLGPYLTQGEEDADDAPSGGQTRSTEDLAYLRDIFQLVDVDNSGTIDKDELKLLMERLGHNLPDAQIEELFNSIKSSGQSSMSFDNFASQLGELLLASRKTTSHTATHGAGAHGGDHKLTDEQLATLRGIFDHCDADGSGDVDVHELEVGLQSALGKTMDKAELAGIISHLDEDKSGSITWDEFLKGMGSMFAASMKPVKNVEADLRLSVVHEVLSAKQIADLRAAWKDVVAGSTKPTGNPDTLDADDLKTLLAHIGKSSLSRGEMRSWAKEMDPKNTGVIEFEAFLVKMARVEQATHGGKLKGRGAAETGGTAEAEGHFEGELTVEIAMERVQKITREKEKFESALHNMEKQYESAVATAKTATSERSSLQERVAELLQTIDGLQTENKQIADLNKAKSSLLDQLANIQAELEKSRGREEALQKERAELVESKSTAVKRLANLQSEFEVTQDENNRLTAHIEELEKGTVLPGDDNTELVRRLQADLEKAKGELTRSTAHTEGLQAKLREMEEEIRTQSKKRGGGGGGDAGDDLAAEFKNQGLEIADKQAELVQKAQSQLRDVQIEKDKILTQVAALKNELDGVKSTLTRTEADLTSSRAEVKRLEGVQAANAALEEKAKTADAATAKMQAERDGAVKAAAKADEQLARAKETFNAIGDKLNNELEQTKKQLAEKNRAGGGGGGDDAATERLRAKITAAETESARLQTELDNAVKEMKAEKKKRDVAENALRDAQENAGSGGGGGSGGSSAEREASWLADEATLAAKRTTADLATAQARLQEARDRAAASEKALREGRTNLLRAMARGASGVTDSVAGLQAELQMVATAETRHRAAKETADAARTAAASKLAAAVEAEKAARQRVHDDLRKKAADADGAEGFDARNMAKAALTTAEQQGKRALTEAAQAVDDAKAEAMTAETAALSATAMWASDVAQKEAVTAEVAHVVSLQEAFTLLQGRLTDSEAKRNAANEELKKSGASSGAASAAYERMSKELADAVAKAQSCEAASTAATGEAATLREKMAAAEQEKTAMASELSRCRENLRGSEGERNQLQQDVNAFKAKLAATEAERMRNADEATKAKLELTSALSREQAAEKGRQTLLEQIASGEQGAASLSNQYKDTITRLETAVADERKAREAAEGQAGTLKSQLAEAAAGRDQEKANGEAHELLLASRTKQLAECEGKIKGMEDRVKAAEAAAATAASDAKAAMDKKAAAEASVAPLQETIRKLEADARNAEAEFEGRSSDRKGKIATLTAANEKLEGQLAAQRDAAKDSLDQSEVKYKALEARFKELETRGAGNAASNAGGSTAAQTAELQARIKQLETEVAEAGAKATGRVVAVKTERDAFEAELNTAKKRLAEVEPRMKTADEQLAQATTKLKRAEDERAALATQLSSLQSGSESSSAGLQATVKRLTDQLNEANGKLDAVDEQTRAYEKLKYQAAKYTEEKAAMEANLASVQAAATQAASDAAERDAEARTRAEALQKQLGEAEAARKETENRTEAVKSELATANARKAALESELAGLKSSAGDANAQVAAQIKASAEAATLAKTLEGQLADAKRALADQKTQLDQAEAAGNTLQRKVKEVETNLQVAETERQTALERCRRLEEENRAVKEEVEISQERKGKIATLTATNEKLEEQLAAQRDAAKKMSEESEAKVRAAEQRATEATAQLNAAAAGNSAQAKAATASEVAALEAKLKQAEDEATAAAATATGRLVALKSEKTTLEAELELIKKKAAESESKLRATVERAEKAEGDATSAAAARKKLEDGLASAQSGSDAATQRLTAQVQRLEQQVAAANEDATKAATDAKAKVKAAENAVTTAEEELATAQTRIRTLEAERGTKGTEAAASEASHKAKIAQLTQDLEETQTQSNEYKEKAKKAIAALNEANEKAEEVEALTDKCEKLRQKALAFKQEKETVEQSLADAKKEIEALTNAAESRDAGARSSKAEKLALEDKLSSAEQATAKLQAQVKKLEEDMAAAAADYEQRSAERKGKVAALTAANDQLEARLAAQEEASKSSLGAAESKLRAAQQQVQDLSAGAGQAAELAQRISVAEQARDAAGARVTALEGEVATLRTKVEEGEATAAKYEKTKAKLDKSKAEKDAVDQELVTATAKATALEARVAQLEAMDAADSVKSADAEQKLAASQAKVTTLKQERETLREQAQAQETRVAELTAKLAEADAAAAKSAEKVAGLKEKLEAATAEQANVTSAEREERALLTARMDTDRLALLEKLATGAEGVAMAMIDNEAAVASSDSGTGEDTERAARKVEKAKAKYDALKAEADAKVAGYKEQMKEIDASATEEEQPAKREKLQRKIARATEEYAPQLDEARAKVDAAMAAAASKSGSDTVRADVLRRELVPLRKLLDIMTTAQLAHDEKVHADALVAESGAELAALRARVAALLEGVTRGAAGVDAVVAELDGQQALVAATQEAAREKALRKVEKAKARLETSASEFDSPRTPEQEAIAAELTGKVEAAAKALEVASAPDPAAAYTAQLAELARHVQRSLRLAVSEAQGRALEATVTALDAVVKGGDKLAAVLRAAEAVPIETTDADETALVGARARLEALQVEAAGKIDGYRQQLRDADAALAAEPSEETAAKREKISKKLQRAVQDYLPQVADARTQLAKDTLAVMQRQQVALLRALVQRAAAAGSSSVATSELQAQVDAATSDLNKERERRLIVVKERDDLAVQVARANELHREAMEAEKERTGKEVAAAKKQATDAQAAAEQAAKSFESARSAAAGSASSAEVETLKSTLAAREASVTKLEKEKRDAQASVTALGAQITELQAKISALERAAQSPASAAAPAPEPKKAPKPVRKPGAAAPAPAPAPAPEPKKVVKTRQMVIQEASAIIGVLLQKISAAVGDGIRMRAATQEAEVVLSHVVGVFREIMEACLEPEKQPQLTELKESLERRGVELQNVTTTLASNPDDAEARRVLEITLRTLQDTWDLAIAVGTSSAVKLDLREAARKVPLFSGVANVGFFNELVRKMKELVFKPNQFIIRYGEVGNSMYFLTKGSCSVLLENGETVGTMKEGEFFGEIAVLIKGNRTASIRTDTYVDAYELEKSALLTALEHFPEYKERIMKVGEDRLMDDMRKKRKRNQAVNIKENPVERYRVLLTGAESAMEGALMSLSTDSSLKAKKEVKTAGDALLQILEQLLAVIPVKFARGQLKPLQAAFEEALESVTFEGQHFRKVTPEMMADATGNLTNKARWSIAVSEMRESLPKVPIFADVDDAFQEELLRGVQMLTLPAKHKIIQSGASETTMYFILEGTVQVILPNGQMLGNLTPGEYFGENGFLTDSVRTADVVSNVPVILCSLDKSVLDEALKGRPEYVDRIKSNNDAESKALEFERLSVRKQFAESLDALDNSTKAFLGELYRLQKLTPKDLEGMTEAELSSTQTTLTNVLNIIIAARQN